MDNNSVDGSINMVKEKFPQVILIESKINTGFSKGNNIAIRKAKGEYILLLNPDTLVEEDTFEKVLNFMDKHPNGGGLGVKMVDGKGDFLPESKRSLPTPIVAFCKIFGLSALFPKSKRFGRYHLGHLSKDENHEVEILSGAFMLLRKKALDEVGILDENFFMYGEDVDLSYRLIKGGYKNYYFSETRIIHYKGESTKKSSVNYVFIFYNAMIIFAKKHFSHKNAFIFSFLIKSAIYFRAFIAVFSRFIKKAGLPFLDFFGIFSGIYIIVQIWVRWFKEIPNLYPKEFIHFEIPIFILIWLISVYFSGGYKTPFKLKPVLKGIIGGTIVVLIIYSLLNESLRFSRAILILGAVWSLIILSLIRLIIHFAKFKNFEIEKSIQKRIAIVGSEKEIKRVQEIIQKSQMNPQFVGWVSHKSSIESTNFLGNLKQLGEVIQIHKINEVILCAKDISSNEIISSMEFTEESNIEFKIAPPESHFIIGSSSIDAPGELYLIDINSLNQIKNKRNKRFFDFISSLTILFLSPIFILFFKNGINLIKPAIFVLLNKQSWVGYSFKSENYKDLPKLKPGIFSPTDLFKSELLNDSFIEKINIQYVNDYSSKNDLKILLKGIRKIER